jgi:flagellar hook-associated protein 3 FlgL
MRVSTSYLFESGTASMQRRIGDALKLQQQLASQRRMLTPSDDPVAAAQALEVTQSQNINSLYMKNQNNAGDILAVGESNLTSANTLLQSMYTSMVRLGDGALADTDRRTIATELRESFKQLMGIANETDGLGNYLFSGYSGNTQPFVGDIENGVSFVGDSGGRSLQVSPSRSLQVGESGLDVFMRVPNKSVPFQAGAAAGNGGSGVVYAPTVTNPTQWNVPGNTQIYDVVFDNPSTAPAPALSYTINDYTNTAVSTGTYTPAEIDLPDATTLNLANAPVLGGTYSTTNYNVVFDDPSTAAAGSYSYTVFDKQGKPVSGYQSLSYTPATIALPNGGQVSMTGTPNAGDSFNINPAGTTDVFSVISDLVLAAEKPYQKTDTATRVEFDKQLGFALSNIQSSMDNILKYQSNYGSRMKEAEELQSAGSDRNLQYKTTLSRLEDVDLTQAISDLTQTETALTAAQQSFSMISRLSLFNYI